MPPYVTASSLESSIQGSLERRLSRGHWGRHPAAVKSERKGGTLLRQAGYNMTRT